MVPLEFSLSNTGSTYCTSIKYPEVRALHSGPNAKEVKIN